VLHPQAGDAGHRYVQRMQQAVKVLYGQASPSEALQAASLELQAIDLDRFLRHVADNAHFAGIDNVRYLSEGTPVMVRADEFSLEDVVTHILRNADRHRAPGTPITIALDLSQPATASASIHNSGAPIDSALLERVFEYGVSSADADAPIDPVRRGQGLFVARTYMGKMGGAIEARNEGDGVTLRLTLARSALA
jgi:two-component system, OmpR family, sensor kinase